MKAVWRIWNSIVFVGMCFVAVEVGSTLWASDKQLEAIIGVGGIIYFLLDLITYGIIKGLSPVAIPAAINRD